MTANSIDSKQNITRMDDLLKTLKAEQLSPLRDNQIVVETANFHPAKYPGMHACPVPVVSDITCSKTVALLNEKEISKVADVAFRYLMQLEFFDAGKRQLNSESDKSGF